MFSGRARVAYLNPISSFFTEGCQSAAFPSNARSSREMRYPSFQAGTPSVQYARPAPRRIDKNLVCDHAPLSQEKYSGSWTRQRVAEKADKQAFMKVSELLDFCRSVIDTTRSETAELLTRTCPLARHI